MLHGPLSLLGLAWKMKLLTKQAQLREQRA